MKPMQLDENGHIIIDDSMSEEMKEKVRRYNGLSLEEEEPLASSDDSDELDDDFDDDDELDDDDETADVLEDSADDSEKTSEEQNVSEDELNNLNDLFN